MAKANAPNGSKAARGERGPGRAPSRALRELLILGTAMAFGLFAVPFLIWLVGNRVLGPYTHGAAANGVETRAGPLVLLGDYFGGLAHGSLVFWAVAVGPAVLIALARLLYACLCARPTGSTTAAQDSRN